MLPPCPERSSDSYPRLPRTNFKVGEYEHATLRSRATRDTPTTRVYGSDACSSVDRIVVCSCARGSLSAGLCSPLLQSCVRSRLFSWSESCTRYGFTACMLASRHVHREGGHGAGECGRAPALWPRVYRRTRVRTISRVSWKSYEEPNFVIDTCGVVDHQRRSDVTSSMPSNCVSYS